MHPKKRRKRQTAFLLQIAIVIVSVGFFATGTTILAIASVPTPDLSSFAGRKVTQTTKIYDRTGEILLYNLHDDVQRRVVPISDISRHIKNATVAIEDDTFYEHPGVRVSSFVRAVMVNALSGDYAQGGSTITQQVVKNSILTPEKTITRKVREWVLALKLEQTYSKDEILTFYLNESPYGGNIYGIEEASILFFGKPARDVSVAEAAYLAALPQAPTYFSPYGNHRDALDARKNLVLSRMHTLGFINEEEFTEAKEEEVVFKNAQRASIIAPHFVFYVRDYLEQKYGRRVVEENGLKVITTLDVDLQT
jgi:penicillin-binding protein 1A